MKILVVDDRTEFLDVARAVAAKFPEVQFGFTTSAADALKRIAEYDGVVTDMFFPSEEDPALNFAYRRYMRQTADSPAFFEVIDVFYGTFGGIEKAEQKLRDCLELMRTGTIRDILEKQIGIAKQKGYDYAEEEKCLENLPAPEFPYGGVIMLKAKALGKKCILITNLHHHATSYDSAATAIDGFMLLLPLIEEGIVTAEEVSFGFGDSYISNAKKEKPEDFRKAIKLLLKQTR